MEGEGIYIYQDSDMKQLIRFHLCGTTLPDANYKIIRTDAKLNCIEYIESGKGTLHTGNSTCYPETGDSYFLHAGKDHSYFSDRKNPWKKYYVNVSGQIFDDLVKSYGLQDAVYFKGLNLEKELKKIIEIAENQSEDCTSELIAAINEILKKMYRYHKYQDDISRLGQIMKDFIDTQITKKFYIEDLCNLISRSESQTLRIFKKTYGITPYQYLLDKKIGFAKKLLENTNLSIREISQKLCFFNEFSFSNAFKKRVGYSPNMHRKWANQEYKNQHP